MRCGCLLLVVGLLLPGMRNSASASEPGEPIFSPKPAFRIPIDVPEGERQRLRAIRLFYSNDEGTTWVRYSDGDPSLRVLTFDAKEDGVYWFTLALVGADGRQEPPDIRLVEPGLKVVVDSTPPTMTLKPIRTRDASQRGVRWEIEDAALEPNSFQLAVYRGDGRWEEYPVEPDGDRVWFAQDEAVERLQAVVSDRAGNRTVVEVHVVGDRFSKQQVPAFVLDAAGGPPVPGADAFVQETPREHRVASPPPSFMPPPPPGALVGYDPERTAGRPARFAPGQMPTAPNSPFRQMGGVPAPTSGDLAGSAALDGPTAGSAAWPEELTEDVVMLNSRSVVVNYELDGPKHGSERIELWATFDNGETWEKVAVDADATAPVEGKLPRDGVCGLKVVNVSDPGPAGGPPKPGDEPNLYVAVDTSAPQLQFETPEVRGSRVVLRWDAADPMLAQAPVHILYSTEADPEWRTIVANHLNGGEYVWDSSRVGLDEPVYFRLEVQDVAGNVAVGESSRVDVVSPTSPPNGPRIAEEEGGRRIRGRLR